MEEKKNLEWDDEVRSTTYQRDKTRKHMDERWGDWTRRCSGDGDWAVSCVDVVVKILISSGIAEMVVDEFTTVQRCWEMKRKKNSEEDYGEKEALKNKRLTN